MRGRIAVSHMPRTIAVVALLAGALSACGSSSKSSSPTTAGSSGTPTSAVGSSATTAATSGSNTSCSSQPGITPTSVKVGLTYAETGATGAINDVFGPSAHAAFDAINAAGGINGRKITWADADTESDPGHALVAGQGLVESNGVFAILNGTSIAANLFPYLAAKNIPTFDVLFDAPLFATQKNFFTTEGAWDTLNGGAGLSADLLAQFLKQQGVTSFAIFDSGSPSGLAAGKGEAAAIEKAGIKLVYEDDATPSNAFDATSVALRVKQVKPDALVYPLALAGSISIYKAVQQQGYTPKVEILSTGYTPQALTAGIAGVVHDNPVRPVSWRREHAGTGGPGVSEWYGEVRAAVTNLGLYAAGGWADAYLFAHALQLAGQCPTRDSVSSAMRAVSSYNPAGLIAAPIQYTPGIEPDGNPLNCQTIVKINRRLVQRTPRLCVSR